MSGSSVPSPSTPRREYPAGYPDVEPATEPLPILTADLPPVTVVIPTRDRPELLRRAVNSVLNQDYLGDIECLVVFDQTAPHDLAIPAAPANRQLQVLHNTRTPGLAGARNTGYLAAEGEVVCNCDDDDEWLPGKLAAQLRILRHHPEVSVVSSGVLFHYHGRDISRSAPAKPLYFGDFIRHRHPEIHPSTFLMRRSSVMDGIGLIDENIPGGYGEDYEWLLRATRTGPVHAVPRNLVRVRWHAQSHFSTRWPMIYDALTWLLDTVPEFRDDPRGIARVEGQIAFSAASMGRQRDAAYWALKALRHSPANLQAWASLMVLTKLFSGERILAFGHRFGRGV